MNKYIKNIKNDRNMIEAKLNNTVSVTDVLMAGIYLGRIEKYIFDLYWNDDITRNTYELLMKWNHSFNDKVLDCVSNAGDYIIATNNKFRL